MLIEDIFKQALAPRHAQTGEVLAVGVTTKTGDWVLLQPVEERPGYKQLRLCVQEHARQLQELDKSGKLKRTRVEGLGCDVVVWNPG